MQVLGPSLSLIRNVFGTLSGPFLDPSLGPFGGAPLWGPSWGLWGRFIDRLEAVLERCGACFVDVLVPFPLTRPGPKVNVAITPPAPDRGAMQPHPHPARMAIEPTPTPQPVPVRGAMQLHTIPTCPAPPGNAITPPSSPIHPSRPEGQCSPPHPHTRRGRNVARKVARYVA